MIEKNEENKIEFSFMAKDENVSSARLLAASFSSQMGFTLSEVEEIKVAVSEGVSNAIIHGYKNNSSEMVSMELICVENLLTVIIKDKGCGIANIEKAMEPMFSTISDRMGLGFVFMQSFMDDFKIVSQIHEGTTLILKKTCKL
ncbi:MAG: anti-sigma F factor [Clostridiales bacterium]